MENMKTCTKCHKTKPLPEYHAKSCRKSGKQAHCKKCHSIAVKASRKKAMAINGMTQADYARLRKYNITKEQFIKLNIEQDYCCKICGIKLVGKVLDVDHDHDTGKIRGLLCSPCNRLLSNCRENLDILASATSYLQNAYSNC